MNGDVLANRTAMVTGGSSGLGRGIALALARAGARVGLVARTRAPLDGVVAEIGASGGVARALVADVTDRDQVDAAVAETERSLGPVSILVNNAGRALPYGPVGSVDPHIRGAHWSARHSLYSRRVSHEQYRPV
jgi:NAD(P)-dependent dehydrogenase (short-subunit alcohol dehydrogenase family)